MKKYEVPNVEYIRFYSIEETTYEEVGTSGAGDDVIELPEDII